MILTAVMKRLKLEGSNSFDIALAVNNIGQDLSKLPAYKIKPVWALASRAHLE